MMPLHKVIQKILLLGATLPSEPLPAKPQAPEALKPLIAAIRPSHQAFNSRAIEYGYRYRSAFWAIYLLSAIAVLCACLPLALGWDDEANRYNHFSII